MQKRPVFGLVVPFALAIPACGSQPNLIELRTVNAAVKQAGFSRINVYSGFGIVAHPAKILEDPPRGPYMVAVRTYRPRYGVIAAVWFRTRTAAEREDAADQPFLRGRAPRNSMPSDVVIAHVRQVRVCNVVITTGRYQSIARRFNKLVALLRRVC